MAIKLTIRRRSAGNKNPILGFVTDETIQASEEALDIDDIYDELGLIQVLVDFAAYGPILISETKEGDVEEYLADQDDDDEEEVVEDDDEDD